MFTVLFSFLKSPTVLKFLAILAIAAGAATFTFSKTRAYYIAQGDSRVLKITEENAKCTKDFDEYRLEQAARLRALEVSSSAEAQAAAGKILLFQQENRKVTATYEVLRSKRKEVAGNLSSAAVDTINSGITK